MESGIGYFEKLVSGDAHPPPKEIFWSVQKLLYFLKNGKGILTKRSEFEPYCRVVFFDDDNAKQ